MLANLKCQEQTKPMKTKKTNTAKVGNLPGFRDQPEEPTRTETAPAVEESNGNKPKERFQLSFDLNEDGTPDFSAMRGKTKEKVRQFFSDPRIAAEFGASPAPTAEVQIFHPAMISGMYDMLGTLESLAAQRWGKIPEPVARQVFKYTDAEKNALSGPTLRVMNKYAADWMIKYQDEIALATLLVSVTVAKVNAAIMLSKMQTVSQPKSEEATEKKENEPIVQ
jgi:hypothetical protein